MSGWQTIDTAPKDGTRLRLGHDRDADSMRDGSIFRHYGAFEDGGWKLNAFFVVPVGRYCRLSCDPTHWRLAENQTEVA